MARINIPPVTRSLLIVLVGLTTLNSIIRPSASTLAFFVQTGHGSPLLSLVPGQSFMYPWTLVSATFVEQNIFGLMVTAATLLLGGRYLERAWGLSDFVKFILLVCVIPNALCFSIYIFFYGASKNGRALTTTVSGGIAIQSAFLVAFKQLVPEHTVSLLKGVLRVRVKHFPWAFLLANTISGIVLGTDTAAFLSWIAFITAWTYLRFYRRSPLMTGTTTGDDSYMRGDASDTFAFASFFPDPLQAPLAAVSHQIYALLVSLKVCTPFTDNDVNISNEQASSRAEGSVLPSTMGGGRREEAERRRAVALRALDQRLHTTTPKATQDRSATILGSQIAPTGNSDTQESGDWIVTQQTRPSAQQPV